MDIVLSPVALLGGAGMIVVALGFTLYAVVRRLPWKYLIIGMLAWVVTVSIKIAIAIPMNLPVYHALAQLAPGTTGALLIDLYVGLLTGMTEVLLVWIVMRRLRLGRATFDQALAFGIGFGAVEALLLGIGSFATVLTAIVSPQSFPPQIMAQLTLANSPLLGIAPIVERVATILVHIVSGVLIFFGVVRAEWRWFWIAFVGKSLFDAWAAFGQFSGMTGGVEQIWILESVVIVSGIISWAGTWWLGKRYPTQAELLASPKGNWQANTNFAGWMTLGVLVLVVLVLALAGSVMQNNVLTGKEQENVLAYGDEISSNLLTALNENDYVSFSRDLNDRMKATITQDKLAELRQQINGKIGNYVSRRIDRVERTGEYVTLIYAAKYENDDPVTVRISLTVTEPHLVSGLWFDSEKLRN